MSQLMALGGKGGFLRPPWALAYDRLFEASFTDWSARGYPVCSPLGDVAMSPVGT